MKRKLTFMTFLLLFLLMIPGMVQAANIKTHINLDGRELLLPKDGGIQTVKGSIMIPLRVVTEELGYQVSWENRTQTATIQQGTTSLKLVVGKTVAEVNGSQLKLENPPILSGSTTLVPLRFVGEQTGTKVSWDNVSKTAYVVTAASQSGEDVSPPTPNNQASTADNSKGDSTSTTTSSLTGVGFADNKLQLSVQGSVTPKVFKMTGPDRVVVDLPNTSFDPSFGNGNIPFEAGKQSGELKITDYPGIKGIRYAYFSKDPVTVRVVVDLESAKGYQVIDQKDGLITLDFNAGGSDSSNTPNPVPIPSENPGASGKKIVVIDAGHGGTRDSGAISVNNRKEKDFTLPTALKVERLLANDPEIEVIMTRTEDVYPTLTERVNLANNVHADVFVSIHANKSPDGSPGPNGSETHYTHQNSQQLAKIMQKYLLEATGLRDRGLKTGKLQVTKNTNMPAVLLECAFLSNPKEEAMLYTDEFQERVAEGVVKGLKEYFGLN